MAQTHTAKEQGHSIWLYLITWGLLFVLSACSYFVDYIHLQGGLRWSLILLFMLLKAVLIMAIFMHMAWEHLALICAVVIPPLVVLIFVGIMMFEADYTLLTRQMSFATGG